MLRPYFLNATYLVHSQCTHLRNRKGIQNIYCKIAIYSLKFCEQAKLQNCATTNRKDERFSRTLIWTISINKTGLLSAFARSLSLLFRGNSVEVLRLSSEYGYRFSHCTTESSRFMWIFKILQSTLVLQQDFIIFSRQNYRTITFLNVSLFCHRKQRRLKK